ncbi:MAG TPA: redoxin domain-containing protein [Planctomycetes bacterium]|nr:redoxin domain-containing protein [Planctomycetota bacterium]HIN80257.1 redoxin domain-containing protein [Planctomycetota bacterium]
MKKLVALILGVALIGGVVAAQDGSKDAKTEAKKLDFTLKDLDGKAFTLADIKDKYVVIEWTESACPAVRPHYSKKNSKNIQGIVKRFKDKGVVWLAVCSTSKNTVEGLKKFRSEFDIKHPILTDFNGKVGKLFGAKRTPHMFVLKNGEVLYQGAIDDRKSGNNYVVQALDELMAGKAVSTPRTRPYG